MFDFDTLVMFVTASVLLALAPGPDNIFVLTQSMVRGARAGILVTLGLCTGLLVHTAAVALGVAAVIQTSVVAFTVLKFVGAGYLLYGAGGDVYCFGFGGVRDGQCCGGAPRALVSGIRQGGENSSPDRGDCVYCFGC